MKSDQLKTTVLNMQNVISSEVLGPDSVRFTVNSIDNRLDDLSVHVDQLSSQAYRAEVIYDIRGRFSMNGLAQ